MDTMNTKIKDTYEGLKSSIEDHSSIQTIRNVLFILFLLFCVWTIIETCMRLYNFGMSTGIKLCFVGILIIVYIYYQDNNEVSDSNEWSFNLFNL